MPNGSEKKFRMNHARPYIHARKTGQKKFPLTLKNLREFVDF